MLECEYQADNDTKGLYGFMIHVLDEEKSVLTIVQNNTLNQSDCFRRINKIQQILNTGKTVYIGAMGELVGQKRRKEQIAYVFPKLGKFNGNGQSLQFIVIANEKGLCYDVYSGNENPCPRDPFALQIVK